MAGASTAENDLTVPIPRPYSLSLPDHETQSGLKENYDYIFKIVLVGNSETGKTSLARRYTVDRFYANERTTVGVDFTVASYKKGDRMLKVQLWDTAGSRGVRFVIPSYFRYADAIGFVYDSTDLESFLELEEWYKMVQCHAETDTFFFLVGTKYDLAERRTVSSEDVERFAKKRKLRHFETSAKTGLGVHDAFDWVTDRLERMSLPSCYPSKQMRIRLGGERKSRRNKCC